MLEAALAGEPQKVTRSGRLVGVVLAAEEYERLRQLDQANAPTLSELLLALPQDDEAFERIDLTRGSFRVPDRHDGAFGAAAASARCRRGGLDR